MAFGAPTMHNINMAFENQASVKKGFSFRALWGCLRCALGLGSWSPSSRLWKWMV